MELRQLELVLAVAEEGTLSRAAARLHVVQSAVSASLASLERELGTPLFVRTPRRAVPTDAGTALLEVARRTLAEAGRAREVVREAVDGLRGTLTVGTMTTHHPLDLPALLGRFARSHPAVHLELRSDPEGARGLVTKVASGDLDVALASAVGDLDGVQSVRLGASPMRLLLAPEHPLAGRATVTLADLRGESWVCAPRGFGNRQIADAACAAAGVPRRVSLEVAQVHAIPDFVRAGLGPALHIGDDPAPGLASPRVVGPAAEDLVWPVDLVTRPAPRQRAVTKAFAATVLTAGAPSGRAAAPDR
ncbi:LysR family transcriptional regulator [Nocardioides bruguierae]|uniref:LysR family transcriptional regulator n=1 Tax=Nocardioides bruguierae TaxID=2945102 RepID=UPI002022800D|nr:LysR family transcriptional regulator [Nocardioides bruguierae]MCL8025138.1 LysR family transcriptional regulator [Nocardioides bruguierae]